MSVQFIEIAGSKMAILPFPEYERLIAESEDARDISSADAAIARRVAGEEYLPAEFVNRLVAGESSLRVWRQFRGFTTGELGMKASVGQSYISAIENGKRGGRPAIWRRLADALDITIDEILPAELV